MSRLWLFHFAGAFLLGIVPAFAAIVTPGGGPIPGVSQEVFTWAGSAPNSTFAFWDSFEDFPGGTAPGGLGPGASPAADAAFSGPVGNSTLTFNSFALILSSGNAYGFNFGDPRPVQPEFVTDAFSTVRVDTSGGNYVRIVAQWQTLGTELDYGSILLSLSAATEGTIAPDLSVETGRGAAGGFGGDIVSRLVMWDFDTSQSEYRIDFNAMANHMSFDQFRIDTFTQDVPFGSAAAIPEPSSLAIIGLVTGAVAIRRRLRNSKKLKN